MRNYPLKQKIIPGKVLFVILIVFSGCSCILGQKDSFQTHRDASLPYPLVVSKAQEKISKDKKPEETIEPGKITLETLQKTKIVEDVRPETTKDESVETKSLRQMFLKPEFRKLSDETKEPKKKLSKIDDPDDLDNSDNEEKFHWKSALKESFYFLGIQHGFRMLQKKTTDELGGPFFRDWGNSVKNLDGWRDGDNSFTNYIAHPMQGAVTGRIFLNNSDKDKKHEFGNSKEYWASRFKAMAWSATWSTQFELGPISEASIGNVGLYDRVGPNRMGWVDIVVTPTAGTAVLIGEDIIDKYIVKKWLEKKTKSRTRIKIYRTFLTPFQSFTNVLGGKAPWRRDNR